MRYRTILAASLAMVATMAAASEPITVSERFETLQEAVKATDPLSPKQYSLTGAQREAASSYNLGNVAERFARDNATDSAKVLR